VHAGSEERETAKRPTSEERDKTMTRHISVTDTAKLVRQALKANFPSVTFSVKSKSYSMGASVTVRWFDGPTSQMVKDAVRQYEGATFDGMTDLKEYKAGELNGERVHFGADWVHCNRKYSPALLSRIGRKVAERYGKPVPTVVERPGVEAWYEETPDFWQPMDGGSYGPALRDVIWRELERTAVMPAPVRRA
jgi:hypothetical protein